eukprot:scaffold370_cov176-Amphora_coffeaeformis.AAC.20
MSRHGWINIEGLDPVKDAFYRYQMPPPRGHSEKTWTVIPFFDKTTNALHRQKEEVLKFLGLVERASKANFPIKTFTKRCDGTMKNLCSAAIARDQKRLFVFEKAEVSYRNALRVGIRHLLSPVTSSAVSFFPCTGSRRQHELGTNECASSVSRAVPEGGQVKKSKSKKVATAKEDIHCAEAPDSTSDEAALDDAVTMV